MLIVDIPVAVAVGGFDVLVELHTGVAGADGAEHAAGALEAEVIAGLEAHKIEGSADLEQAQRLPADGAEEPAAPGRAARPRRNDCARKIDFSKLSWVRPMNCMACPHLSTTSVRR